MKKIHFCLGVLFVVLIQLARGSGAAAVIERPGADNGPTRVSIGIWMVNITGIDSAQQDFTAEVAIVLRWKDPRFAHTGTGIVRYPLDQVWHPRMAIVNETSSVSRKFPELVEVDSDGPARSEVRILDAPVIAAAGPNIHVKDLKRAARGSEPLLQQRWVDPSIEDALAGSRKGFFQSHQRVDVRRPAHRFAFRRGG